MKITNRSIILWNIMIFSILSVGLFHVSGSDLLHVSAFSRQSFYIDKKIYSIILALASLSFLSIYFVKNISKLFFTLTVLSVAVFTSLQLTNNFSKFILVLLFVYLIISYYYYQFLNIEVNQASYKPNYNSQNLFDPMLYKIECEISLSEDTVASGVLTNWDENGCFVKMAEKVKLPKEFKVKFVVDNEEFFDQAKVVSKFGVGQGYGLKLKQGLKGKQAWNDFINYTNDMGLLPEIVQ